MLRKLLIAAVVLAVVGFAVFWWLSAPQRIAADSLPPFEPSVERGRLVFFAGGCASCHATPNQDDRLQLGGGRSFPSPFGTFYAPNISPHPERGIGRWSEADFVTAVLRGVSPGGEHYFPAFPYTTYTHMRPEDARDLFAFIKTLPAVETGRKAHELPLPFQWRRPLGIWKVLFMDETPFRPDPSKSEELNRGAYLVESMAHCAECHSPRNLLGGIITSERFAGGPDPEGGSGWVPNITPGQGGIADWSEADVVEALTTGFTPDFDSLGGSMAEVVRNTSQLSDADRKAIAAYIKSLPPRTNTDQPATATGG